MADGKTGLIYDIGMRTARLSSRLVSACVKAERTLVLKGFGDDFESEVKKEPVGIVPYLLTHLSVVTLSIRCWKVQLHRAGERVVQARPFLFLVPLVRFGRQPEGQDLIIVSGFTLLMPFSRPDVVIVNHTLPSGLTRSGTPGILSNNQSVDRSIMVMASRVRGLAIQHVSNAARKRPSRSSPYSGEVNGSDRLIVLSINYRHRHV